MDWIPLSPIWWLFIYNWNDLRFISLLNANEIDSVPSSPKFPQNLWGIFNSRDDSFWDFLIMMRMRMIIMMRMIMMILLFQLHDQEI